MSFFSILIPTRNRPHFLRYALTSLKNQNFTDFEVIVSENSDNHEEGIKLVQELNDPRFKVVVPDKVLNMNDNWNFALSYATGRYVTVKGDKAMFLSGALKKVWKILEKDPQIEIINWMSDFYSFVNEDQGPKGFYHLQEYIFSPTVYSSKKELKLRMGNYIKMDDLGKHYLRGHIYHGFYSSQLIKRIVDQVGKLFHPMSPDYTSLTSGLILSHKSYDVGQSLELSCNSKLSNATRLEDSHHRVKFQRDCIEESFEDYLKHLPIPGVNYGHTNHITYDFCLMIKKSGQEKLLKCLNIDSLFLRVREEVQKYNIDLHDILSQYHAEHHLRGIKRKIFVDNLKRKTSIFTLKRLLNHVLIWNIARYVPKNTILYERRQHSLFCHSVPCHDPLQGLEFGHNHYKKLKHLEYE